MVYIIVPYGMVGGAGQFGLPDAVPCTAVAATMYKPSISHTRETTLDSDMCVVRAQFPTQGEYDEKFAVQPSLMSDSILKRMGVLQFQSLKIPALQGAWKVCAGQNCLLLLLQSAVRYLGNRGPASGFRASSRISEA